MKKHDLHEINSKSEAGTNTSTVSLSLCDYGVDIEMNSEVVVDVVIPTEKELDNSKNSDNLWEDFMYDGTCRIVSWYNPKTQER